MKHTTKAVDIDGKLWWIIVAKHPATDFNFAFWVAYEFNSADLAERACKNLNTVETPLLENMSWNYIPFHRPITCYGVARITTAKNYGRLQFKPSAL